MEYTISKATKGSANELIKLVKELYQFHIVHGMGEFSALPDDNKLSKLIIETIENDNWPNFYVCKSEENEVVGYINIGVLNDDLVINNIYLLEKYRGNGIGVQMLNFAKDIAKKLNKKGIIISNMCKNERASRLYESLGYMPIKITRRLNLERE